MITWQNGNRFHMEVSASDTRTAQFTDLNEVKGFLSKMQTGALCSVVERNLPAFHGTTERETACGTVRQVLEDVDAALEYGRNTLDTMVINE